ncbi:MAG: hypothetical protein K6C68_03355 [Ruminococcus sp.]|nr:hypothetical protein [Ruminococcus sp.]
MSGVNLGSSPAMLYLGEIPISTGGGTILPKTITENGTYNASADSADGYSPVTVNVPQPAVTTATAAADLTGYSGNPDLGNGFEVTTSGGSGTIAVDSETIGGVTYNGLRISGGTTIRNKKNFGKMSTLEIEFIVDSFVSGANRLISTGGYNYDFSVYTGDDDYLHYVAADYHQILDPNVYRSPYGDGNCTDNGITKASLIGAVTNIRFIDDGTYTTLYVNDVAKVSWQTGYANNSFFLYGLNVGANGAGGADMLITKLRWTADGIEYDGRNWVPV